MPTRLRIDAIDAFFRIDQSMEEKNSATSSRVRKVNRNTPAARWNLEISRRIRRALDKDPEADITALLPSTYSKQLRSMKTSVTPQQSISNQGAKPTQLSQHHYDIRSQLDASKNLAIISEPSPTLQALFPSKDLSHAIVDLLEQGRVLYNSPSTIVLGVHDTIAAKITHENLTTEQATLSYLQRQLPNLPIPRPHGLVRLGTFYILFTSLIPGVSLDKIWSRLEESQKQDISYQLDYIFSKLRSLPFPDHHLIGGVDREGCKDIRRNVRTNFEPIERVKQFEDFIFTGSIIASPLYVDLLRSFAQGFQSKCVFTHGDVRPANIMMDKAGDGNWKVVAIIDWDASGFYPEYWECVKVTNNLTSRETCDWYKYVPKSLSPQRYPIQWLVDRVWDRDMINS
ncbi:hypothetical protein CDD81_2838 [Ophiocordyceps australis]|uniref:Aminoglycoside phosphotransferase domain-containing protein n=1 Tax=Ophiocordyceps australis TaxID=1399860 RepID=A0A2C5XWV8_9HYPO|nr:hypothetical protein CDD81_2838 [Ophiocordyceps australis]